MPSNGKSLREVVAETLMVEPALTRAEVALHSSKKDGCDGNLRERIEELLHDAPTRPAFDGFVGQGVEPGVLKTLRLAFEESLN